MNKYQTNYITEKGYGINFRKFYQTSQEVRACRNILEKKALPELKKADRAKRAAWARASTRMLD